MYSYDECLKASTEYFGNELTARAVVDKYLLRDYDNNLVEKSPDDYVNRIVNELSRIEERKFKNPLSKDTLTSYFHKFKKLLPQGSVAYGIGNPYQTISLSNCVHGESLVYTKEHGLVKMKDIVPGIHVLTHKNRFRKVLRHWSNGQQRVFSVSRTFGHKRPNIRTENELGRFLGLTKDHRVFTEDNKWAPIEDFANKHSQNRKLKEPQIDYTGNIPSVFPLSNGKHIYVDDNFMWLCGMYLAEGAIKEASTNHPNVYFTLNIKEEEYAERISNFSKKYLGNPAWIQRWDNYNFIQVNIFEPLFADLLDSIFGKGFADKRLPEWIFGLDNSLIESLIDGFLCGDGINYKNLKENNNQFALANPTLCYEISLLARKIGLHSRTNFLCKGRLIKHRTARTTLGIDETHIILNSFPDAVEVFDMEVEEDHSFVAGDIICHNCFVIETYDSYAGICKTDEWISQISKRRGGTGTDISPLRPKNMSVKNAAKTTTGAVSFMHRFSHTLREVGQHGRRGAGMLSISCKHPEVMDFATVKNDGISVTGANISIRMFDDFFQALENNEDYELKWPVDSDNPKYAEKVSAKKIWDTIIHSAWYRAEPGLLFWDRFIQESPADCYSDVGFRTISTNPCGELPLCFADSCRLLAIVLFSCVKNAFKQDAYFDYNELYQTAQIAQRIMDDIVDLELEAVDKIIAKIESDPEPEHVKANELWLWKQIKEKCNNGRRTGLGITSLGDVIAALGIIYGSEESIKVVEKIYQVLKMGAYRSSVNMAKELGAFPVWDYEKEKNCPFLLRIKNDIVDELADTGAAIYNDMQKYGRRNIALLTTAPTGTVSMLAQLDEGLHGSTSGIEPLFSMGYTRRKKGNPGDKDFRSDFVDKSGDHWMHFEVNHPGIEMWKRVTGETDAKNSPYYKSCANDIDWVQRVKLQAAAQKHVDHSISSTINLPNDVTEEKVGEIYLTAWKAGCKGMTVYRDGCRDGVLIDKIEEKGGGIVPTNAPKRPKELPCDVYHISVKGSPYFVLVGLLEGRPYEIFAGKNGCVNKNVKTGTIIKKYRKQYKAVFNDESELAPLSVFATDEEEVVTRLISTALRHGSSIQFLVHQLEKTKGGLDSFAKSIIRALKKYIPDGDEVSGEECEECGAKLIREEGCRKCASCGWSKC